MKKILSVLLILTFLISCNTQKAFSEFDFSYSKSGGHMPTYENLLIKDNKVYYSIHSQDKKTKKRFKISEAEAQSVEKTLSDNQFRKIIEDRKKIYDRASVTITVNKGQNTGSKSDASLIMAVDQRKWENIVEVFQKIIDNNVNNTK
ncbi:hypothetical protein SAMN05421796_105161 [Chryseobacterium piscicola]|uniref:Lipoprotein n=1 Tax=Chryseobacterium piscicola TaxID=551459 RepID=A0A1N7MRV2_9FLAO|nr:hypothetical protein [Chryseobacterium piscicola]PQA93373.1 hypothetical protein B0A70_09440 [Chryseobacterium piscicola]SIS88671.1 hypothetical protein SAMN05421796_105161 [Chryseobacterium piscicola]